MLIAYMGKRILCQREAAARQCFWTVTLQLPSASRRLGSRLLTCSGNLHVRGAYRRDGC